MQVEQDSYSPEDRVLERTATQKEKARELLSVQQTTDQHMHVKGLPNGSF